MKLCPVCHAPLAEGSSCTACGHRIETRDGFELFAPEAAHTGTGYDPAFYTELAALEDRNFWFQARNRLIVRTLRHHVPGLRTWLEIGCGTGQVLRAVGAAFPAARLGGSELFVEGLAFARQRVPSAHLMQMDATAIPYAEEFDAVGAFDVLEHIKDDRGVIAEIRRALKPGGVVVFTVPQHPWLWSHQDVMAHHVRRYRRGELEHKLESQGLCVRYTTSFVSLLLPLLLLSRRARPGHTSDPFRELRIGSLANRVLGSVMAVEAGLLGGGARFPLGGSRLVVAAKSK